DRRLGPGLAASAVDPVAVTAARARGADEAVVAELGQDALHRAFLDPDHVGDVADPYVRVTGEADQDLAVIGEKFPAGVPLDVAHSGILMPDPGNVQAQTFVEGEWGSQLGDSSASAFLTIWRSSCWATSSSLPSPAGVAVTTISCSGRPIP